MDNSHSTLHIVHTYTTHAYDDNPTYISYVFRIYNDAPIFYVYRYGQGVKYEKKKLNLQYMSIYYTAFAVLRIYEFDSLSVVLFVDRFLFFLSFF